MCFYPFIKADEWVTLNQLVYLALMWLCSSAVLYAAGALCVTYGVNELCCAAHMSSPARDRTVLPFVQVATSGREHPTVNGDTPKVSVLYFYVNMFLYASVCLRTRWRMVSVVFRPSVSLCKDRKAILCHLAWALSFLSQLFDWPCRVRWLQEGRAWGRWLKDIMF